MAATLSIRLRPVLREVLAEEARKQGTGLSALVREIAESEAKRLLKERIKADSKRVVEYLKTHPGGAQELEDYVPEADDLAW